MTEMTSKQTWEAEKGMDFAHLLALFEKVLGGFDKLRERQEETAEQMRKTDEQMRKTDERIEKMAIEIGGLGNSIGLFMETLFSANLWDKFAEEGYEFEQGGKRIFRYKGKIIAEVDFFLENGKYVMAVEVKTSLTEHYVNEHLKKLEKIRAYFDKINDKRVLLGAVAGPSVSNDVIQYAQQNGLYVIVQSGNAVKIADKIEDFSVREW